jgi:hypothetical protein
MSLDSRIKRLKGVVWNQWLASKTEDELEEMVVFDEIGQYLRSLSDGELKTIAKGGHLHGVRGKNTSDPAPPLLGHSSPSSHRTIG